MECVEADRVPHTDMRSQLLPGENNIHKHGHNSKRGVSPLRMWGWMQQKEWMSSSFSAISQITANPITPHSSNNNSVAETKVIKYQSLSLTFPSEEVPATCPVAMVILSGWTARLVKRMRWKQTWNQFKSFFFFFNIKRSSWIKMSNVLTEHERPRLVSEVFKSCEYDIHCSYHTPPSVLMWAGEMKLFKINSSPFGYEAVAWVPL